MTTLSSRLDSESERLLLLTQEAKSAALSLVGEEVRAQGLRMEKEFEVIITILLYVIITTLQQQQQQQRIVTATRVRPRSCQRGWRPNYLSWSCCCRGIGQRATRDTQKWKSSWRRYNNNNNKLFLLLIRRNKFVLVTKVWWRKCKILLLFLLLLYFVIVVVVVSN